MNETMKTLLGRRSIRGYKLEQIKDEELQLILDAAKYAPTAMNQQPWHFSVAQSKEMLTRINEACKEVMIKSGNPVFAERAKQENFSIFYNAPTLIIVSADEKAIAPQADATLALGNMFLAAESLNIGSCWINGVLPLLNNPENQALRADLGIPEGYRVYGSGAFGYKAQEIPTPAPRKEGTVTIIK